MAVIDIIKERRSCRKFISKKIEDSKLNSILEAGRLAPSAKNRQPWRFITITDESIKEKILNACYGIDTIKTADKIIAVCTTNINYTMPNGLHSHICDLSIATSFMMLQAEYEGLGSCSYNFV